MLFSLFLCISFFFYFIFCSLFSFFSIFCFFIKKFIFKRCLDFDKKCSWGTKNVHRVQKKVCNSKIYPPVSKVFTKFKKMFKSDQRFKKVYFTNSKEKIHWVWKNTNKVRKMFMGSKSTFIESKKCTLGSK